MQKHGCWRCLYCSTILLNLTQQIVPLTTDFFWIILTLAFPSDPEPIWSVCQIVSQKSLKKILKFIGLPPWRTRGVEKSNPP